MAQEIDVPDREPRTERGRKTLRKLLDAASQEFAERGFHDASISGITRSAGVALGTFYTYFESKDEIFRALVKDMSAGVGVAARSAISPGMNALEIERAALTGFLAFADEHRELYRIIDEAEFVDPASYRDHYEAIALRIEERLQAGAVAGDFRDDLGAPEAWALMGMNVFLGLRYTVWARAGDPGHLEVAERANRILKDGIAKP